MESWELKAYLEAILIASDRAVKLHRLSEALGVNEQAIEDALLELDADLSAADRGVQIRHRAQGIRLEVKPQYAGTIGLVIPEWAAKPITSQALESLAIIALAQPATIADVTSIRGIESAGTLHTLRNRKLIAPVARQGSHREKLWRTTPLFLEKFNLENIDELRNEGRMEQAFPSLYNNDLGELEEDDNASLISQQHEPNPEAPTANS